MNNLTTLLELILLVPAATVLAWCARFTIKALTRRAVRRAQERPGTWRGRLRRLNDIDSDVEVRRRQRADAAARMLGHLVTTFIVIGSVLLALHIIGVDPVYAISSAGFIGVAIALSGQDIIKNLLAGTMALLEDRYAVGDQVTVTMSGNEVSGTIDLMGAASIRVRTEQGATWHAGHSAIDSVTNFSQLAASSDLAIPTVHWNDVEDEASRRLTTASNDVGLTGVVFLPELASQEHPTGVTTVTVRSNRPLTDQQKRLVHERLVEPPAWSRARRVRSPVGRTTLPSRLR
ncbi:mechanosensitive ion channel family protein [Ilumatobacter nonamiensis]|uniref:mechanosensitive ion channel family protein n=1 Tax=Ilumatobacter nonamiensis TaxID=467093 RepID=UPI0003489123|nr:mechanosensitive ion channel domain-containing protein [Ilumatobacter nonamiensis]